MKQLLAQQVKDMEAHERKIANILSRNRVYGFLTFG